MELMDITEQANELPGRRSSAYYFEPNENLSKSRSSSVRIPSMHTCRSGRDDCFLVCRWNEPILLKNSVSLAPLITPWGVAGKLIFAQNSYFESGG